MPRVEMEVAAARRRKSHGDDATLLGGCGI
jgi:hypothetical protein